MHRLGLRLAGRHSAGWQAAVVGVGQGTHLGRVDIASHHHHGVGRHIPALVKSPRVVGRHGLQVGHPAHHRAAVGRGHKHTGTEGFVHERPGVVFGAQAALLFHHFKLFGKLLVAPLVVGKAVGFQLHHVGQPVRWNLLVIAGEIFAGEGIFLAAQRRHPARKLARFEIGRAFEHHVFEHMGHAAGAVHLVHGAHPNPQHVNRSGGAAIGFDDQRHAVGEGELRHRWGRHLGLQA